MLPALRNLPSIPHFSKYPAMSLPLLIAYALLTVYFSKKVLGRVQPLTALRFGLVVAALNFLLDVGVYFLLLRSYDYFQYLSVWVSYVELLVIPWILTESHRQR